MCSTLLLTALFKLSRRRLEALVKVEGQVLEDDTR